MTTKRSEKTKTFLLPGDITSAGRVKVVAKTKEEAIEKAEGGDYEVWEADCHSVFEFSGGMDDIEEI